MSLDLTTLFSSCCDPRKKDYSRVWNTVGIMSEQECHKNPINAVFDCSVERLHHSNGDSSNSTSKWAAFVRSLETTSKETRRKIVGLFDTKLEAHRRSVCTAILMNSYIKNHKTTATSASANANKVSFPSALQSSKDFISSPPPHATTNVNTSIKDNNEIPKVATVTTTKREQNPAEKSDRPKSDYILNAWVAVEHMRGNTSVPSNDPKQNRAPIPPNNSTNMPPPKLPPPPTALQNVFQSTNNNISAHTKVATQINHGIQVQAGISTTTFNVESNQMKIIKQNNTEQNAKAGGVVLNSTIPYPPTKRLKKMPNAPAQSAPMIHSKPNNLLPLNNSPLPSKVSTMTTPTDGYANGLHTKQQQKYGTTTAKELAEKCNYSNNQKTCPPKIQNRKGIDDKMTPQQPPQQQLCGGVEPPQPPDHSYPVMYTELVNLELESATFDSSRLLPLPPPNQISRRNKKYVELIDKHTGEVLVNFRGNLDAGRALGIDRKKVGRACLTYKAPFEIKFPGFRLRYKKAGMPIVAYEYGKHKEDYMRMNETHEVRMARWKRTFQMEQAQIQAAVNPLSMSLSPTPAPQASTPPKSNMMTTGQSFQQHPQKTHPPKVERKKKTRKTEDETNTKTKPLTMKSKQMPFKSNKKLIEQRKQGNTNDPNININPDSRQQNANAVDLSSSLKQSKKKVGGTTTELSFGGSGDNDHHFNDVNAEIPIGNFGERSKSTRWHTSTLVTLRNPSTAELDTLCIVCQRNKSNVIFQPCQHSVICIECSDAGHCAVFCPSCRVVVDQHIRCKTIAYIRPRIYSAYSFLGKNFPEEKGTLSTKY